MLSAVLAGALQSPRLPLRRASESDATWAVEVTTPLGDTHTLEVPERHNLLRAVERAGLLPASDCRRGNCLSCAARVLDGAVRFWHVAGWRTPSERALDAFRAFADGCSMGHREGRSLWRSLYLRMGICPTATQDATSLPPGEDRGHLLQSALHDLVRDVPSSRIGRETMARGSRVQPAHAPRDPSAR